MVFVKDVELGAEKMGSAPPKTLVIFITIGKIEIPDIFPTWRDLGFGRVIFWDVRPPREPGFSKFIFRCF